MGYRDGWARLRVPCRDERVTRAVDLSPAMQVALLTVRGVSGSMRLDCEVLIGTRVALIHRGLVIPGAERYLTPAGEEAHAQLAGASGSRGTEARERRV